MALFREYQSRELNGPIMSVYAHALSVHATGKLMLKKEKNKLENASP